MSDSAAPAHGLPPGNSREVAGARRALSQWLHHRGHRLLVSLAWTYAVGIVAIILAIRFLGERSWVVTLLLFSPRFLWLAPILPLLAAAVWLRSLRLGLLAALDVALVAVPLMGFTVPWRQWIKPNPDGPRIRILTLNRGPGRIDVDALNQLISQKEIDILCFQEAEPFGFGDQVAPGYHWNVDRRIASRFQILREVRPEIPRCSADSDLFARVPIVTVQVSDSRQLRVALVDMPSMTAPISELLKGRFTSDQFRERTRCRREYATALISALDSVPDPLIVAGDFNTPPDSDVLAPFAARWTDSFTEAGWGLGHTWPAQLRFLRLDRILRSRGGLFTHAEVGPPLGSDHRPYWAELIVLEEEPRP